MAAARGLVSSGGFNRGKCNPVTDTDWVAEEIVSIYDRFPFLSQLPAFLPNVAVEQRATGKMLQDRLINDAGQSRR
jgi:hypothetical protein